ncbi:MAG: hypothetical protein JRM78_02305 [Nitrososphaerota archaeon]|nr:hypothetical protein [Nitrososphaerota archaeon]
MQIYPHSFLLPVFVVHHNIGRLLEDLAEHAELASQALYNDLRLSHYEMDELWTTVKKNRKRLSAKAQLQLRKVAPTSTLY